MPGSSGSRAIRWIGGIEPADGVRVGARADAVGAPVGPGGAGGGGFPAGDAADPGDPLPVALRWQRVSDGVVERPLRGAGDGALTTPRATGWRRRMNDCSTTATVRRSSGSRTIAHWASTCSRRREGPRAGGLFRPRTHLRHQTAWNRSPSIERGGQPGRDRAGGGCGGGWKVNAKLLSAWRLYCEW